MLLCVLLACSRPFFDIVLSFIDTLPSTPPESKKSANSYYSTSCFFLLSLLSGLSKLQLVLGHCIVLSRDCCYRSSIYHLEWISCELDQNHENLDDNEARFMAHHHLNQYGPHPL